MTKEEHEKYPLPYYGRINIVNSIIGELKGATERKEKIIIKRNIRQSTVGITFSLSLGKFLHLLDSDSKRIWLTDFGYRYSMLSQQQQKELVAKNLPDAYVTLLKWIKNSEQRMMTIDTLKDEILKNFIEWKPTERVFYESLLTFADVVKYCHLADFVKGSRGSSSRFKITEEGINFFDSGNFATSSENTDKSETKGDRDQRNREWYIQNPFNLNMTEGTTVRLISNLGAIEKKIETDGDWDKLKIIIDHWKEIWKVLDKERKNKPAEDGKSQKA